MCCKGHNSDLQLALTNARHENAMIKTEIHHLLYQHEQATNDIKLELNKEINDLQVKLEEIKSNGNEKKELLEHTCEKQLKINEQLMLQLKICDNQLNMKSKECKENEKEAIYNADIFQHDIDAKELLVQELKEKNLHLEERLRLLVNDLEILYTTKNEQSLNFSEGNQMQLIKSSLKEIEQDCETKISKANMELVKAQNRIKHFENMLDTQTSELRNKVEEERSAKIQFHQQLSRLEKEFEKKYSELQGKYLSETHSLTEDNNKLSERLQAVEKKITNDTPYLQEEYNKLSVIIETKNSEELLRNTHIELRKERANSQKKLIDLKLKEDDQMSHSKARSLCLENQLLLKTKHHLEESNELTKKLRLYGQLIKKLRFKLETADLKGKDLQAKHDALKDDSVPSNRFMQIQNQLKVILHKHAEFRAHITNINRTSENIEELEHLNHQISCMADQFSELEQSQKEALSDYELI